MKLLVLLKRLGYKKARLDFTLPQFYLTNVGC